MPVSLDDDLPAVAGHKLRAFLTERWGVLVRVGITDAAFTTLDAAVRHARDNPLSYDQLTEEFRAFGILSGFREGDAEELLMHPGLTDEQRLWLVDFVHRWQSIADYHQGFGL